MRLIDADKLLDEKKMHLYYHLPNGDIAIPIIDIKHAQSELIKCKDCKYGGIDSASYPHFWCSAHTEYHEGEYFCADGELK